jgi:hypothetical protein
MQLEAGKYYRDTDGCKLLCVTRNPLTIYEGDRWICVSAGGCVGLYSEDGIADNDDNDCNLVAEWADPATQPARPPLDLSKPIVSVGGVTGGAKLSSVKSDGIRIKYYLSPSEWYTCDLDGYSNGVQVLRQAVRKPWSCVSDVPDDCEWLLGNSLRMPGRVLQVNESGILFAAANCYSDLFSWSRLSDSKWSATRTGDYKECCKWE